MADGKYHWNIVPFGLATAVSTFQYLMSKVLTGLYNFAFMYLDDVLIFSQSYEEHLQHLHSVFQKFKEVGLKIKLSKCQFFKMHLHYLGHRISADGLKPLPEKLEVLKNLAPAKNVDETHQILGLLGYYRSFVPAFADITSPITNLLKKNTPFMWSQKFQLALNYLKQIFCDKHILKFQTPTKITYYTWTLPIMCIPVSYVNQSATTKIIGQLHIFQVLLQHKTKVGVQLKRKLMQS